MAHEKEVTDYQTGEVETVNDNFVQLYVDKLDLIIEMTSENPTAVKIFTWLLKHMDKRNALVVSQPALAEAFNLSDRTIRSSISYLKGKKALSILKSGTQIFMLLTLKLLGNQMLTERNMLFLMQQSIFLRPNRISLFLIHNL